MMDAAEAAAAAAAKGSNHGMYRTCVYRVQKAVSFFFV